ncbi:MAG: C40 family peptidase [Treponema sp.]
MLCTNKIRLLCYSFCFMLTVGLIADTKAAVSSRIIFINTALRYSGAPYKFAGSSASGMDCSGLVYRSALTALELKLARRSDAIASHATTIEDEQVLPGDLLFFKTVSARISHVGIYLGAGKFLHAVSDGPATGVIVSKIQESYWKKNYDHAGRILVPESIFNTEKQGVSVMLRTSENSSLHPDIKMP